MVTQTLEKPPGLPANDEANTLEADVRALFTHHAEAEILAGEPLPLSATPHPEHWTEARTRLAACVARHVQENLPPEEFPPSASASEAVLGAVFRELASGWQEQTAFGRHPHTHPGTVVRKPVNYSGKDGEFWSEFTQALDARIAELAPTPPRSKQLDRNAAKHVAMAEGVLFYDVYDDRRPVTKTRESESEPRLLLGQARTVAGYGGAKEYLLVTGAQARAEVLERLLQVREIKKEAPSLAR